MPATPVTNTIHIKTKHVIYRDHYKDGTLCPASQGYWRASPTEWGGMYYGWDGPKEATRYDTREEAVAQISQRELHKITDLYGCEVIEVVEDTSWPDGWVPLSSVLSTLQISAENVQPLDSKDDAIRDPDTRPEDYLPKQGPAEAPIRIPDEGFFAILTALRVENEQLGFAPYSYYHGQGKVTHYKHFRTFQLHNSEHVDAFHFENDFIHIYIREGGQL